MNPPRLRVPRSLQKQTVTSNAVQRANTAPSASFPSLLNSSISTAAHNKVSKPSDEQVVTSSCPSPTTAITSTLSDLIRLRFALDQYPADDYCNRLASAGLKVELETIPTAELLTYKRNLDHVAENYSHATRFLDAHRDAEYLETQKVLRLYEHASMMHEDRVGHFRRETLTLASQLSTVSADLEESGSTLSRLETAVQDSKSALNAAAVQLQSLKEQQTTNDWKCTATLQLFAQINEALREFHAYRERLVFCRSVVESKRRKHHNRLQELRGNLRVFCRIRPPLDHEIGDPDCLVSFAVSKDETRLSIPPTTEPRTKTTQLSQPSSCTLTDNLLVFRFDRVFSPSVSQHAVFQEVLNLIQSALDGFNVALFAYGQTGSGKTYTMEGKGMWDPNPIQSAYHTPSAILPDTAGIIPRAVELIFQQMSTSVTRGWTYRIDLSVLEVYNETIRDLLGSDKNGRAVDATPSSGNVTARSATGAGGPTTSCEVKLDAKGNVTLTNVVSVPVRSSKDVYRLLQTAQRQRSVAATACNEHSSRSHSIFQLKIHGHCLKDDKRVISSVLSMVDLAGSERIEKSLVTGDRLREAQYINRSLSCLGDVIHAIAEKKSHVPFRNSKLTMLLKNSLGGQAKTLMFVNVSPLRAHLQETLTSLRFAVKANNCSLA